MILSRFVRSLRHRAVALFAAILGLAFLPCALRAQELLQNGGFESSAITNGATTQYLAAGASMPGWAWSPGDHVALIGPAFSDPGANPPRQAGNYSIDLGAGTANSGGQLWQNFTATAGGNYLVSYWIKRWGSEAVSATVSVVNPANGVTVASSTPALTNTWQKVTFTFAAPSASLRLLITDTTATGAAGSTDILIDSFSVLTQQNLTIYGTDAALGTIDPNTDCSRDGGASWLPAYAIWHPWGQLGGTTSWIGRNTSGASDPNVNDANPEFLDFRIRFYAPTDITAAQVTYYLNADNYGDVYLNGTKLNASQIVGNSGVVGTATITDANVVAGLNTILVKLKDTGGLLGINYRVDVQGYGSTAFQRLIAPPSATSVSSTSTNGSYKAGSVIPVQVTFNRAVTVTGTPTLTLETGTTDRVVNYASGSGTGTLTFSYAVQSGDTSADLDYISTAALALNGGSIKATAADLQDANLTLPAPGAAGSLSANKALVVDGVLPTVAISTTAPTFTTAPIPVTIVFSEPVTGFTASDISATNATVSNFSGSGTTYTATVFPVASPVTTQVVVPANVAQDLAGNPNLPSNNFSRVYDITPPTVTITSSAAGTVNTSIPVTFTFSENVTGFVATDLAAVNCTVTSFVGAGTTYTATLVPTNAGTFAVQVPANVAIDSAGNNNGASVALTRTYDNVAPTVAITSSAPNPTKVFIPVTFTFSESVSGFTVSDITVTNGVATNFSGSGTTYTATIAPSLNGTVSVSLAAGVAQDSVGNNNAASATFTRIFDSAPPVITAPTSPIVVEATNAGGAVVNFTVSATDARDGAITPVLSKASGSVFAPGTTTVTVTATDAAGNLAIATFDVVVRYLTLTEDKTTVTVAEGGTATNAGTFNEVTGANVSLSQNLAGATLAQTGAGQWTFQQMQNEGGNPIELVLDTDENLYVANENNTVYKYDAAGNLVRTWTTAGDPKGIAIDNVNHWVYVTSSAQGKIYKYDLNGNQLASFGALGSNDGQFTSLHCVAVDSAGNVYATDPGNPRVQVFDSNGTFLRKWGTPGGGDGQFNACQGIRIASNGTVYVADRGNNRVQYFDPSGTFLGAWGSGGSGNGQFNQPASIGIDPSGNVYVGDIANNRVQKFSATGAYLDKVGPGFGDGQLAFPHGTAFPPAGRSVYIASWSNGRVVKYLTPGAWSWSYQAPLGSAGTSTVTITANDGVGTATQTFNLVVTDATAPRVASIVRRFPTASPTNSDTLTFRVSFSEDVLGVDATDFVVAGTTATTSLVIVNSSTYDISVSGGDLAALNGTVTLGFAATQNITDFAGNALANTAPTGTNENTFVLINNQAPTDIALTPATMNQSATFAKGATVGTLSATDPDAGDTFTYALVSGVGSADNTNFAIAGSTLTSIIGMLPDTFHIRVRVTDAGGLSFEKALTVTVLDDIAPNTTITAQPAALSRSASATFSFAATEAGATFEAKLDNGGFATATSPLTLGGLADGAHTFQVRAKDAAGNADATPASFSWIVDTQPPTIAIATIAGDDRLNAIEATAALTISGSTSGAENGRAVAVKIAGQTYATSVFNNAWSVTLPNAGASALAEQVHAVTADVSDAAGNAATTAVRELLVDKTAPLAPVVAGISDDTGSSATDGVTNDTTLVIRGTAEASSSVEVFKGGASIGRATADASGAWSFDYTGTTLGSGEHAFTANATDAAGNTGAISEVFVATIDTTIATPVIASVSNDTGRSATDGVTSDNTLVLAGTAEPRSTVAITRSGAGVVGSATADANGAWSFDYSTTTLADGAYLFTARATDTAGNTSAASADFPIAIDTAVPTIAAASASGTYRAAFTHTVVASETAVTFTAAGLPAGLTLDAATGEISGTPTDSGTFSIALTATDIAGNTGNGTLTLTLAKVNLTIAGITAADRVYDATTTVALNFAGASLVGVLSGDDVALDTSAAAGSLADKRVGHAKLVAVTGLALTGPQATHYTFTAPTTTASITPRALTLAGATAANKVYDGNALAALSFASASLVNIAGADDVSLLASGASGAFANASVGSAKSVVISGLTLAGVDAANYTLTSPTLSAAITARPIAVAADAKTKIYNTADPALTYGITSGSLVAGDAFSGALTRAAGENVGTYTITQGTLALSANYALSFRPASLTITPADATIAFGDLTFGYNGQPKPVVVTTAPVAGLATNITYNGSTSAPTLPGAYTVVATLTDPNYRGAITDTLFITITAIVRHAPQINGDIDGSLQVLLPESIQLNGGALISGDLLVPGTPAVRLNGSPTFAGTLDSTGAANPSTHQVTLNGGAVLRKLIRRVDALALATVAAPPAPTGTRSVTLNKPTDPIGDWATLRNLTLNGAAGVVTVPAGTYGNLSASGNNTGFVFGVAGSGTRAIYHLQNLTLNGNTVIRIAGPVTITLANGVQINGDVGDAAHPEWLTLRVANGDVTLNGGVDFAGDVIAPNGQVTINGNSTLKGHLSADRLALNGGALLVDPEVKP